MNANSEAPSIWGTLIVFLVAPFLLLLLTPGCPSQDETRRKPDDGAGSKTGEADATEAPKPSV